MRQINNITWIQNDKELNGVKDKSLTKDAKNVAADTFACKVSNEVSALTSDAVTQNCYKGSKYHVFNTATVRLLFFSM